MADDSQKPTWCRLTIPNDATHMRLVQQFVSGVAEQIGFDELDRSRIELAVEEAVGNVIEHAFAPGETAHFDVTCDRVPNGIEIRIHDDGLPHDPTLAPEYDPSAALDKQAGEGLGGFLMKKLTDRYEFHNLGAKGKETRLVKFLDTPNVTDEEPGKEPEIPLPPDEEPAVQAEFEIRQMQREEAIEVARCVYDSYGYSYANEHIYYPERVAAMNESGDILSAVAVSDTGEIGGHVALIFHEHFAPELGIAVVKQKFRGCKLATRLGDFLVGESQSREAAGLQVKQVTVHPYTQKFCQKQGYLDCGFLLAHSPKTLSFKGIADELEQRNSDVVGYKFLRAPEPSDAYLPSRHAEAIRRLYANLDAPLAERNASAAGDPGSDREHSVVNVSINAVRSLAEIRVPQCGDDIVSVLKQELRRVRREEVRVVEMFLPLSDPAAAEVVPELEALGFFFTGIMPGTADGDATIMQYFNGIDIDYSALHVVSEPAQELLAYIEQHDPYSA